MAVTSTVDLRKNLADLLSRAQYTGERITVTRNGRPVAALIPIEDLELLQALEDRIDGAAADEAKREAEQSGTISWEDLKRETE